MKMKQTLNSKRFRAEIRSVSLDSFLVDENIALTDGYDYREKLPVYCGIYLKIKY